MRMPSSGASSSTSSRTTSFAEDIGFGEVAVAELDFVEVGEQALHEAVHLLSIPEAAFVVEGHARQHAFEVFTVLVFNRSQGFVDLLGAVLTVFH